jgi:hypothetical protein
VREEAFLAKYGVADLTTSTQESEIQAIGEVRSEQVAEQLREIRDTISQVIDEEPHAGRIGLDSIEISLTVGAEGRVWFVAKGSVEASIKLIFARPEA